jgi:hypothetical protein
VNQALGLPGRPTRTSRRSRRAALTIAAVLALACGLATAQGTTSTGRSFASVSLSGEASFGPLLALRLSADSLVFDLRAAVSNEALCVTSAEPDDTPVVDALFGAAQVLPAGTSFRVGTYPAIEVSGGRPAVTGGVPTATSDATVCYRSFTMSAFSNTDGWQVTVDRFELPNMPVIDDLYLAAVCRDEQAGGVQPLVGEDRVSLFSTRPAGACTDAVVVVAVKLGGEPAGTSAIGLRYTLMSTGAGIGTQ